MSSMQRLSIRNNGVLKLQENSLKSFGKGVNLLARSFNDSFRDETDVENFKDFIIELVTSVENIASFKIIRKIFKQYDIINIALDNHNMLGKDYIFTFIYDHINYIYRNSTNMQTHRDIIDICKNAYNKTGYIECLYFVGSLINGMCS